MKINFKYKKRSFKPNEEILNFVKEKARLHFPGLKWETPVMTETCLYTWTKMNNFYWIIYQTIRILLWEEEEVDMLLNMAQLLVKFLLIFHKMLFRLSILLSFLLIII